MDQCCETCRHGVPIRDEHSMAINCTAPLPEVVSAYLDEPEHADARYTFPHWGENCPVFEADIPLPPVPTITATVENTNV